MRELVRTSAAQWNLSPRTATWIFWAPILGAVLMLVARLDKDIYRFLLTDDGPIEWMQFGFFLLATLAGALVSWQRFRAGHVVQGALFAIFAMGMTFVTGEEISWAQRVLDFETPEQLAEINTQDEATLHNIGGVLPTINIVMMMACFLGAAAYFVNRKVQIERYWADANFLLVPPPFLAPAFLVPALYKLVRFTVLTEPGFTITKYGEWGELCFAFALFAFAGLNYRRLAAQAKEAAAPIVPANLEASAEAMMTGSAETPQNGGGSSVTAPEPDSHSA